MLVPYSQVKVRCFITCSVGLVVTIRSLRKSVLEAKDLIIPNEKIPFEIVFFYIWYLKGLNGLYMKTEGLLGERGENDGRA